eukprot:CAMPEP_0198124964 /NCGR_PEP_ID=MMETSP1442-20131203/41441_1 /TAXON_ID= /ORGANISM="Craspedostauros australis, Strain CCMP3328" /LENGTH=284 /DNA_ID=CAMNT_0043784481 /DNA_START=102 /DNA_END=956 /DNA_ORIENTATION=-
MTFSKILLLGDSLTQTAMGGWGGGLAHIYQRRADVLNRGMSGYNTRWFLRYANDTGVLGDGVLDESVMLVTIFFGANDASLLQHNPHAHVPLEEYKANLETILKLSHASYPNAKILVITPPPVYHPQRLEFQKQRYKEKATGVLERTLENTGLYAAAAKEVLSKFQADNKDATIAKDVCCLDLYQAMLDAGKSEGNGAKKEDHGKFFYDGLHFSATGHDFVLEQLQATITQRFPGIAVTPCQITKQWNNSGSKCSVLQQGPYHDVIQHDDWETAFGEYKKRRLA